MQRECQISALVSSTTRMLLEKHARATGVKKGHLVALRRVTYDKTRVYSSHDHLSPEERLRLLGQLWEGLSAGSPTD